MKYGFSHQLATPEHPTGTIAPIGAGPRTEGTMPRMNYPIRNVSRKVNYISLAANIPIAKQKLEKSLIKISLSNHFLFMLFFSFFVALFYLPIPPPLPFSKKFVCIVNPFFFSKSK